MPHIVIPHMIVLWSSMQGENNIEHTNGKCDVGLHVSMQEKAILEHTNAMCQSCTL
jgi:hypothetical protein